MTDTDRRYPSGLRRIVWRIVRYLLLAVAAIVGFVLLTLLAACAWLAVPRHQGARGALFDGRTFRNQQAMPGVAWRDLLRAFTHREAGSWPAADRGAPAREPPPARVGAGELRVTFINHATLLIQMDGLNLLTDPIWSERASPVSWAGPRRVRPPGVAFEALPRIDAVLVSHNHYDHMDLPTLRRLAETHHPRMLVPLGNRAFLQREGVAGVEELDWWQSTTIAPGLQAWAVPAQHFSSRALCDRDRALWAGFVITGGGAGPVYFAGDTAAGPQFAQIRARFGSPRLALLPIGAYRPAPLMARVHLSPEEALAAHRTLGAADSVAMHFGTFPMAADGEHEPPIRLRAALAQAASAGRAARIWILEPGAGRRFDAAAAGGV